jgi:hypothetical protein
MSEITDFITVNAGDGYDIELTVTENGEVKIVSIDANSFTPCSAEIPLSKEKAVELRNAIDKWLEKGLFKTEDTTIA